MLGTFAVVSFIGVSILGGGGGGAAGSTFRDATERVFFSHHIADSSLVKAPSTESLSRLGHPLRAAILQCVGNKRKSKNNGPAIQTVGGAREAGGRQERRDERNWALERGRVGTGGGCAVG